MAQHILIQNIKTVAMQNIYKSICRQFKKRTSSVNSSLKYQEIKDENFKENKNDNDRVFNTWRTVGGKRECFEIHFNETNKNITNIYLVK